MMRGICENSIVFFRSNESLTGVEIDGIKMKKKASKNEA